MELAHYVQGGIYRKHDRSDTGVFTMFINTRHAAGNNIEIVKRWRVFRCQKYLGEGSSIISEAIPEPLGQPGLSLLILMCAVSMPAAVCVFVHRCRPPSC